MGLDGRFDIVGFDPRGVDRSGGIDCLDDAQIDALLYADDTPDDAAEAAAAVAQQMMFGAACQAGLRRHVASLLDGEHGPRHGHDPGRPR